MGKVVSNDELAGLVGHRFPGGTYRVAHWENFLLTDCTGREPLPVAERPRRPVHSYIYAAPLNTSSGHLATLDKLSVKAQTPVESIVWETRAYG
jgi:hypothetical protein